jgi:hypothetical protein
MRASLNSLWKSTEFTGIAGHVKSVIYVAIFMRTCAAVREDVWQARSGIELSQQ